MNLADFPAKIAGALCSVLASGCIGGDGSRAASPAASASNAGARAAGGSFSAEPPAAPSYSAPMHIDLQSIVDMALADAERRTGRDRSALKVISSEAVTWRDGSLGCPQPGMSYTMALVPGYRIRILAGVELLDYHASRGGHFVLCPPGRSVDPVPDSAM